MQVAKIVVAAATYAIDRPYDYKIPPEAELLLKPGMRVAVPYGQGNRISDGVVLSISEETSEKPLKTISALLDEQPVLDSKAIQLALWMRDRYFCTVYHAIRAMLPAGLWFSLRDCWRIIPETDRESAYAAAGHSQQAKRLLDMLYANNGWAELRQIRVAFGTSNPMAALRRLEDRGILVKETNVTRGIRDKRERIAALTGTPEESLALMAGRRKRAPLQYAAVETLCATGPVAAKELCYFTGASMATLRSLEKLGVLKLEQQEVYRQPPLPEKLPVPVPIQLNDEQQRAYEGLCALASCGEPATALLYGVTGSGKTQVYIQLIRSVLEQGKSSLVLVPEISLTPQLMRIFSAYFEKNVAILHSALSAGERYDEWKRIKSGEAKVVVGTRSAVFAPLVNPGLVILDEEHESSYYSEQNPRYHAREVARYRCMKENALLLLGSATPSVETMFYAKNGAYHYFSLMHRYNERSLPSVRIVDMKSELRQGNGSNFSDELKRSLSHTIEQGEQAILFLNRRGANQMAVCGECGQGLICPRCSVHLTYHSANKRFMCHYCGFSEALPEACPQCGGLLNFIGVGTQQVEEEVKQLFPDTEVLRMDTDTVTAANSHEKILNRFRDKRVPVLVGTQMVAKGLDFENVTLVGVISADQTLYAADYRAGERTFSMLTQVVGRAGRGEKAGNAVIQTFAPANELIQYAAQQDYNSFYEQEIRMRELRDQPPFNDLFVFSLSGLEEVAVLQACTRLRDAIRMGMSYPPYTACSYRLLGPAPAVIAKINDRYRYRLIFNTKNTALIRQLVAHIIRQAQQDKVNKGVSIFADINPTD